MKRICSWCKKPMDDAEEMAPASGLTTHGICPECAEALFSEVGTRVRKILDRINVPVLVINERYEVTGLNESARALLGKHEDDLRGQACGRVLDCEHASLPEGCGNTEHCPNCQVRAAVRETLTTGRKLHDVPVRIVRAAEHGGAPLDLVVSTERVGSMVLLKVDRTS